MFKRVMGDVTFGQVLIKVEDVLCWWLYIGNLDFESMVFSLQTDMNHITVAGEDTLLMLDAGGKRLSDTFGEIAWLMRGFREVMILQSRHCAFRTPVLIMWVVDSEGAGNALVFRVFVAFVIFVVFRFPYSFLSSAFLTAFFFGEMTKNEKKNA